jgi:transcriptional antiterminator
MTPEQILALLALIASQQLAVQQLAAQLQEAQQTIAEQAARVNKLEANSA